MDRPTLQEALASIATQTYQNIEIIVVNASGKHHSEINGLCGSLALRLVNSDGPLSRGRAANLGLDEASGKYVLFLDDDDWLYPDHIASLVCALEESDVARVAYSGVRFSCDSHSNEFIILNDSFDPLKLIYGNFIPIHAVLFEKNLSTTGCRFDEALEVYEDWDFWLQLSRVTPFLHVNQVTAGYRSTGHSGAGPSVEERSIQTAREIIFAKWKHIWSGADVNQLLNFASHISDPKIAALEADRVEAAEQNIRLNELLSANNAAINRQQMELDEYAQKIDAIQKNANELQVHVGALERQDSERRLQLHDRDTLIQAITNSTSWRLTSPIRKLKGWPLKIRKLAFCLSPLVKDPAKIYPTVLRFKDALKRGGLGAAKNMLLQLPHEITYNDAWKDQYRQSFSAEVLTPIRERVKALENPPVISVLMPTYNTPESVLRQTIESVLAQLYPTWELCISDDASSKPHVQAIMEEYSSRDQRIKVSFSKANSGVAAATNRALGMATGQYSILLDHDDLLEPQALYRLAESILSEAPDMIYSDEALLAENGQEIINHVHRPAFSPEYLRSCPYIVHLIAFRTEFLRQLGGLDTSLSISQDYDLILRASEKADKIVHIPEILYLWRQRKQSSGHKLKKDVMETSRQVLSRHLARCGELGIVVDSPQFNYFDVRYTLQSGLKVAIIIPTKNHGELVRQCIDSIVRTVKDIPYSIILVDHASDDEASLAYFSELKSTHQVLRFEGPFNFSTINNWAVSQLSDEYSHYLFCNNDIEAIEDGWLERMLELGQKPDVGIVGAKLLYPDRKMIQHAGVCVGMYGIAEHYAKFMDNVLPTGEAHPGYHGTLIANHEMSAVTAACALMRRDVFERIGGYEEALAVGFGDVDLCLKTIEAGYRVLFCAYAVLIHHESYTRGKSLTDPHPKDSAYFSEKWRETLDQCDPYYNPNLTLQSTRWEIKQPMEFNVDIQRRVWQSSTINAAEKLGDKTVSGRPSIKVSQEAIPTER